MKPMASKRQRCAIYTRKSTEHNLDLTFTSLDAQREACEAYIKSQAHEGWTLVRDRFNDGGLSGASLDRPALLLLSPKSQTRPSTDLKSLNDLLWVYSGIASLLPAEN